MSGFFQTQDLIQEFEPGFIPALFDRSLLIVGLGGNGTHLALAAVRMGFRTIVGVDCDTVSESNLSRQVLYTRQDVGRRKAEAAAESLQRHNLRSEVRCHDFDILQQRRRFGNLVAAADLVFIVLDQPGVTFFAVDACFHHRKPAVSGGTCVLSGLSARVGWMGPGQRPCLNCAFSTPPAIAEWVRFHRFDEVEVKECSPEVQQAERELRLDGGHPSTYPTACLGSSLMMAVGLNLLLGRSDIPRQFELSLLGLAVDHRELRARPGCPTCSTA